MNRTTSNSVARTMFLSNKKDKDKEAEDEEGNKRLEHKEVIRRVFQTLSAFDVFMVASCCCFSFF